MHLHPESGGSYTIDGQDGILLAGFSNATVSTELADACSSGGRARRHSVVESQAFREPCFMSPQGRTGTRCARSEPALANNATKHRPDNYATDSHATLYPLPSPPLPDLTCRTQNAGHIRSLLQLCMLPRPPCQQNQSADYHSTHSAHTQTHVPADSASPFLNRCTCPRLPAQYSIAWHLTGSSEDIRRLLLCGTIWFSLDRAW